MTEADVHATLTEHVIQHLRHTHADAGEVRVVHTHISTVLLAGDFAYKLKRPVRLPFLDFSTLERRHHFLQEELRLNRRTAPQLYLDVRPVLGGVWRLENWHEAFEKMHSGEIVKAVLKPV